MINNPFYQEELKKIINNSNIEWKKFDNKTILITGSTGMIGSFLVDTIMLRNKFFNSNITVVANALNIDSIKNRFNEYINDKNFEILIQNVIDPLNTKYSINYIIHAASNAYPELFDKDPVGTMMGNFIGLNNILDFSIRNNVERVLYVSSGEIYGKIDDMESIIENNYGYVDILKSRSCYPMSKRASETLAISYNKQYNLNVVIVRPCHIFGPTATSKDNRISSLFVKMGLNGENIVLKSKGTQKRSYCYITDCICALLTILDKGKCAEAYNISNPNSIVTIAELAQTISKKTNVKLLFDIPSKNEEKNFNSMENAVLNSDKLIELGWNPLYDFETAMDNNIKILKNERVKK